MALEDRTRIKLSAIVNADPFTAETTTKRRNLLFISCLCVLISVYGLSISKAPWLEVSVPAGATNVLNGALSVALIYSLLVYCVYALVDLRRWYFAGVAIDHEHFIGLAKSIQNSNEHVLNLLKGHNLSGTTAEQRNQIERNAEISINNLASIKHEVERARQSHKTLSSTQAVKVWVFDLGIPLSLGLFATVKMGKFVAPFIQVLFA